MGILFSAPYVNHADKNLNEYLRKKREKKQLNENNFTIMNCTVETMIKKVEKLYNQWIFPPKMFDGYITQSGFKDRKEIYSHYGKNLKKFKCHNGNVYLYKTRIPILDDYRKVYVFTNKERKIIKEIWICD